jgi:hypothetical protein
MTSAKCAIFAVPVLILSPYFILSPVASIGRSRPRPACVHDRAARSRTQKPRALEVCAVNPGLLHENARAYPAPGQTFPPTGISATEILLCYGVCHFASQAGQFAGNPFVTIVDGRAAN